MKDTEMIGIEHARAREREIERARNTQKKSGKRATEGHRQNGEEKLKKTNEYKWEVVSFTHLNTRYVHHIWVIYLWSARYK